MTIFQSIFLGIIQGLTEFLPVSSSGHLAIAQNIFHIDTGGTILFDILLHLGTLAVVFIVYWKDIWQLICEAVFMLGDLFANIGIYFQNRGAITLTPYRRVIKNNYRKFVVLLIVSTIPTGIIGILGKDIVEMASSTLIVPGICLIITGVLLLISDNARNCTKIPRDVTWTNAILIGIAQGIATLPGISRSGATITACLLCGFNRKFAVKYSFILSIPAILGAVLLEISDVTASQISPSLLGIYALGVLAAAAIGYICMKFLQVIVKKRKFKYFAIYCFIMGLISIVGYFVF